MITHIKGPESMVESAERWEVGHCLEGHTVMTLLDKFDEPFAEAHIGDDEDVDHLILALINACRVCTIDRLQSLILKLCISDGTPECVPQPQPATA